MKLRSLLGAGMAWALSLASPSPAAAEPVAGLNMGAPVWNGVLAKDALAASIATGAPQIRVNFRLDKWSAPSDATKHDGRTFFEAYDVVVDAITSQGLEVYGLLSDELVRIGPKDPGFDDAWVPNALAVVERYRDRVRVWETINEPNNWDETQTPRMPPAAFARAHAKLYGAVKADHAGDPCWDVTLVTGPLFSFDGTTGTDYLAEAIAAGRANGPWKAFVNATGRDPVDGVGYHAYVAQGPGTTSVAAATNANLDALRAMLSARGLADRRVWLSEVGFRADVLGGEGQAERLDATFDALAARTDVAAAHWFTVADFGAGESWGLFAGGCAAGQQRPAHARFLARAKRHAPALAARIAVDAPTSVAATAVTPVKVTVTNLGKETWPAGGSVRLGAAAGCPSASAVNELPWAPSASGYARSTTDARVPLPRAVAQGESIVLDVALAPAASGGRLAMRMVKEGEAWFGATASVKLAVASDGPSNTTPPPTATEVVAPRPAPSAPYATDAGCRTSALSSSSPTSWLPLLFAVGIVLVFVRRSA